MSDMQNLLPKVIARSDSFSLIEKKVRNKKTDLYTCMEEGHKKQGV